MPRRTPLRRRFWIETILASISGLLTVLTLITREWIEALTGWDPDHGNGSLEWLIVVVFAVAAAVLGVAARIEWRRPALA
ncbi:MAG: putative rane protein [Frankiales bacterium]|nr:putative rane protein [Frankiales bacterium]